MRFVADAKIGRRQSRFAPPLQSQLGSWERQVGAGEIHCRCKDWEKAKQTCSSSTTFEIVAVSEKSKLSDDADAARHHQIMGKLQ